jgi:hypothetical protein
MSRIELIKTFNPPPAAMVRSFHCAVCDKQHLQTGVLARVWVLYQEGYATQASLACLNAAQQSVKWTLFPACANCEYNPCDWENNWDFCPAPERR